MRLIGIAAVLVMLTSCGGDGGGEVEATGEVVHVAAMDNSFRPETLEIEPGTEVVWTNQGRHDHDVIPLDDGADWGIELKDFGPGEEYRHVFTEPGEYRYYCTIHATPNSGMVGTVVVND